MKDLNEIMVFARVAQQGSFSGAAKSLGMPVSTVSRKVSDLEARLGLTLMQRTTRKLQLTSAGENYFHQCADLLQGFDEAEAQITQLNQQPEGPLRISVPHGMADGAFVDFLSGFIRRYPGIEIDLLMSNRYVDLVGENVDVAIRVGSLRDSNLTARKLGTSHHFLVASPEFVKKRGQPKQPEEIPNFPCLLYQSRASDAEWTFLRERATRRVLATGTIRASDLGALKELALRGHGLAYLPELYCSREIESGAFRRLLPDWRSPPFPVHAVYATRRFPPARLLAFLDALSGWKEAYWERLS